MSHLFFFTHLKTDDSLALTILNALDSLGNSDTRKDGYAGFIGSTLIFFAFLSMLWAILDPSTNKDLWLFFSVEYLGGLLLSALFGFRLKKSVSTKNEFAAVIYGITAGIMMLVMDFAILQVSEIAPFSSAGEGLWLVMLAPIAETLAFDVALYHWFRSAYPTISWVYIAIPSDLAFALYHFFHYGLDPRFFFILLILLMGNTFLIYIYDLTRNATAPMVAHTMVNFATAPADVLAALENFVYLFLVVFVILFIIYVIKGGKTS